MNMRARFALAVFAGLLLGIVVIGSSVIYSGTTFGTFAALKPAETGSAVTQTVTTTTLTTTAAGAWVPTQVANQTTSTLTTISSSVSSTSSATFAPNYNAVSGTAQNALASQVDSITRQPAVQSAVVFLPVVAAVLFGLVLYRVSAARAEEEPASA